jgi:hypothetical protein
MRFAARAGAGQVCWQMEQQSAPIAIGVLLWAIIGPTDPIHYLLLSSSLTIPNGRDAPPE